MAIVKHPYYSVWNSMKQRCFNKNSKAYPDYGGRGITVCERWLGKSGFANFLADLGEKPDGYSLDRIDNNGNYEPSNCQWSSRTEQQRNQRVTRIIHIDGLDFRVADLAEISGFKQDTLIERAKHCKTVKELLDPKRRVFKDGLALGGIANGERQKQKTHCPNGHPYTPENTRASKLGHRSCKICHKEREAKRREALQ